MKNYYRFRIRWERPFQKWMCMLILMCMGLPAMMAQSLEVKGRVLNENGEGLPRVAVAVKGTTQGVLSEDDGSFSLKTEEGAILIFAYIGYEKQELPASADPMEVKLVQDITELDEVVVTGYGQTQNKKVATTAIAGIGSARISEVPVSRPEQLLQGNTPGVIVSQNSGSPGAPLTIRLRGVSTAGGAQPLILVDGTQVPDLNFLNAADIDNISILKDAAASAIYGARGGNGVILVQTKKGTRYMQGPEIAFEGYYGVQNLLRKPELMDRDQYVDYFNAYQNANGLDPISDADRAKLANTDWYDEVFEANTPIQNYNLSFRNGGENYSYYGSVGLFDQNGMVGGEAGKSNYTRQNAKFAFETDLLPSLNVRAGADLVNVTRDYLFENQAGTGVALMNYINAIPAVFPAFDEDNPNIPFHFGDLSAPVMVNGVTMPAVGAVLNPHVSLLLTNNRAISNIRNFNVGATWTPIDNLSITSTYARYEDDTQDRNFNPAYDFRPDQNLFLVNANYTESQFRNRFSQWEGNVTYDFAGLTDHNLDVMGGFSVLESEFLFTGQAGSGFFVNDFEQVNFGLIEDPSTINVLPPSGFETGLFSLYARANYNFREKYLFSGTIRADASSRFGAANRTGIFPSFSAGWVLSEENFLKSVEGLNLLKLRGSWGINGNDNIANYQFSRVLNPNAGPSFGGGNTPGISAEFLANEDVKWEEVAQTNIGIDANLLNNQLGITFDYYNKLTSDMLVPIGTPLYTGLSSAAANVADVRNSGLEFLLSYRIYNPNGFSWNVAANIGYNRNEVTGLGENGQPINGGSIGFIFPDPITRTDVGQPIASFYGFEVEQLGENGALSFRDLDGDGVITEGDKTYIGSPFPDFTYGLNGGFKVSGFDVNFFFYGSQGNDIYDATVRLDATHSNRPVSYGEAGAPLNLLGAGATGTAQTEVSDFYVRDGSFTKLKTLTIGYTLPARTLNTLRMENLRIYVTGQNLLVFTGYEGVDPEIGQAFANTVLDLGIDRGFYPQPRTMMAGFQLKF